MGARPSSFKGGGGRLNGVDAVITGYRFTDEFFGNEFDGGKFKDSKTGKMVDKPHNLYWEIAFRVDGADEDVVEPLRVSRNYDAFEISEDGLTLTSAEGGEVAFNKNTAAAKFAHSLCNPEDGEGFPEDSLSDDPESINFEPIVGTRVRLLKVENEDAKSFSIKQGGSGKRKGKDGKEYNFETLVVAQVYELPDASGKKGKTAAKPVAGKGGKKVEEVEEADEQSIEDIAAEVLVKIVTANKGKMEKSKLSMGVLALMKKDDNREPVRKLVNSDTFLATENGWTYDAKKKVIKVEAE